jgi:hypothetical protein
VANAGVDGGSSAAITAGQVSGAYDQAVAAAAEQGQSGGVTVVIEVEAPAGATSVATSIPGAAVSHVAQDGNSALTVSTPVASVTFDSRALSTMADQASGDVQVTVARVDAATLPSEARQAVGDRPVFSFSVTSGDDTISEFNGSVRVSVPYTLKDDEDPNAVVIYYIDAQGQPQIVRNCAYDPATRTVTFTTSHLSQYAVGYNPVAFGDVAPDAWYADAVSFIAARTITEGTGSGNYSPGAGLTRGDFLVLVMKAYGIAPDSSSRDNFADAGNTYYTGYLAAAKRLGIAAGVGDNVFAPGRQIRRQEMFTLLHKALKLIGRLPQGDSGNALVSFSDAGQIEPWATEAMAYLVKAGTVSGYGGKLFPADTLTRAEFAQVLYNLLSK